MKKFSSCKIYRKLSCKMRLIMSFVVFVFFLLAYPVSCFQNINRFLSSPLTKSNNNQLNQSKIPLFAKTTYKVTIIHDGKESILDVREDVSILSVAIDAGIDLPHDCDMGVCLTCPTRIVSGVVDQTGGTLDDTVIDQGFALSCCSYPRSDVVIRSIDEEEVCKVLE